jgi:hypothetical protein
VGGGIDGFSAWLDRSGRLNEPHKLILAYANAEKARPREVLRKLRDKTGTEDDRRTIGGPGRLSSAQVLLAFMRQLEARCGEAGKPLEGEKAPEASVRVLWLDEGSSRPPLRRDSVSQRFSEPPDSLHSLSQLLARAAGTAWVAYRRSDAGAIGWGWEDGIARVAHGVPARVDRLRALGNAVVPQVAEFVGHRIMDAAS